jgi:hypothetical protein
MKQIKMIDLDNVINYLEELGFIPDPKYVRDLFVLYNQIGVLFPNVSGERITGFVKNLINHEHNIEVVK